MTRQSDAIYYARRADESRTAADNAACFLSSAIHMTLAHAYDERVREATELSEQGRADNHAGEAPAMPASDLRPDSATALDEERFADRAGSHADGVGDVQQMRGRLSNRAR